METKPRILYLKKILEERTDEEHPLSTTQLINILNDEYGISAHRTTVTKDIAALQEFGMDIVTIHSTPVSYTHLIEGKVWNCTIPASKLPECEMRLHIINQRGEDHNQVSIRYLSEHSEIDGSVTTEPRLDVYKRQLEDRKKFRCTAWTLI